MPVNVEFTPEFKRNVRALSKKYRHIREDIEPLIIEIQNGRLPGDQVTGTGYTIFKVRVPNRDVRKGKSGGIAWFTIYKPKQLLFSSPFTRKPNKLISLPHKFAVSWVNSKQGERTCHFQQSVMVCLHC